MRREAGNPKRKRRRKQRDVTDRLGAGTSSRSDKNARRSRGCHCPKREWHQRRPACYFESYVLPHSVYGAAPSFSTGFPLTHIFEWAPPYSNFPPADLCSGREGERKYKNGGCGGWGGEGEREKTGGGREAVDKSRETVTETGTATGIDGRQG